MLRHEDHCICFLINNYEAWFHGFHGVCISETKFVLIYRKFRDIIYATFRHTGVAPRFYVLGLRYVFSGTNLLMVFF